MIASDRAGMPRFSIDRGAISSAITPITPKSRVQDPVDLIFERNDEGGNCPQICFDPAELEGSKAID